MITVRGTAFEAAATGGSAEVSPGRYFKIHCHSIVLFASKRKDMTPAMIQKYMSKSITSRLYKGIWQAK